MAPARRGAAPVSGQPFGRSAELDELRAVLLGATGRSVVVEGPPGIGKTTLWRVLVDAGREMGWPVLAARCTEADADLPFASLAELVEPVLARVAARLPAPRSRNLRVALRLEEPAGRPPDRLGLGLAVVSALEALSSGAAPEAPVMVAVDDLHWMDRESLGAVRFAVRRADRSPFRFLFTCRTGDTPTAAELVGEVRALSEVVPLGPLPADALYALIVARLGGSVSGPALAEIERNSGGNPLYALELARAVRDQGVRLFSGEPAPLPDSLRSAVVARMERLTAPVRRTLAFAAVLASPTAGMVGRLVAQEGGLDDVMAVAEREGVAVLRDERIVFSHPLMRSGILALLGPAERRRVHRAVAEALPAGEERAFHLARATDGPDESVAGELERAARQAGGRGALAAAADLAELARRFSTGEPGGVLRRALMAMDFAILTGDNDRVRRLVADALAEDHHGPELAEILLRAAAVEPTIDGQGDQLATALGLAGSDSHLRARIRQKMVVVSFIGGCWAAALDDARRAVHDALRSEDPDLIVRAGGTLVAMEMAAGRLPPPELLDRALALEDRAVGCESYHLPSFWVGAHHFLRGELDAARPLMEAALHRARRLDDPAGILLHLAELEVRAGRFEAAHHRAAECLRLMQQAEDAQIGSGLYAVALVEAHRGDVASARRHAEEGLACSEAIHDAVFTAQNRQVLAFVALSAGEPEETLRHADTLPALFAGLGVGDPGLTPAYQDAVEAAVMLGRGDDARRFAAALAALSEPLRHPLGSAASARCAALLAAAEGNWAEALERAGEAVRRYRDLPVPFELGRALLTAGLVIRRAHGKRPAREALQESVELFDRLGSPLWADRARQELTRVGGRPASPLALTATELQVAELVVAGLSNQQVADSLFISPSTVEANLTRVYRKLGVRSRTQLPSALRRGERGGQT